LFAEGPGGGTVEGDVIVVVNPAEGRQFEVAGKGSRFASDAFHHVAVATDGPYAVVEDFEAGLVEVGFHPFAGDSHGDGIGAALTEGSGGGLDARGHVRFGVARGDAVELAELFDVIE